MTGRLHIAQVLPSFEWGGTQALIVLFADQARRLNVDVTVVTLNDDARTPYAQQLRDLGARVVVLKGRYALDPRRLLQFVRLIKRDKVDLVHAHLMKPNTLAPIAGLLAKRPVLVGLHTLPNLDKWRSRLRAACESFAVRRSAGAISCADSIAQVQSKRFAPAPVKVVSNPAPCLGPDRSDRPQDGPVHFIAVGRLSPEKGYDLMLDAAAKLKEHGLAFTITIVGDGALMAGLKKQCTALGLDGMVHLIGPRDDIPDLLANADVYLSASRFEGLSIALLEAMGLGLAVVATDVGDTGEVVSSNVGALVPPNDVTALAAAMARFATAPDTATTMGAAAQQHIRDTRAPGPWAEAYVNIYRDTIAAYDGARA